MSVLVVGIGRLVGYANREQRNDGGDQVECGVGRLGEDSQAAGCNAYHHFEDSDGHRRQHGVACNRTLLRAHRARTVDRRCSSHTGIISVGWFAAKLLLWASGSRVLHLRIRAKRIAHKPSLAPLCARIFLTPFELTWRNHPYDLSLS